MPKKQLKQKAGPQGHLNIDPSKTPHSREVMYVAGALATIGKDKHIRPAYQEVAKVASIWLSRVAITLYEQEERTKEENGGASGANQTNS